MELKKLCSLIENGNQFCDAFGFKYHYQIQFCVESGWGSGESFDDYKSLMKWLKKEYTKAFVDELLKADFEKKDGYYQATLVIPCFYGSPEVCKVQIWLNESY